MSDGPSFGGVADLHSSHHQHQHHYGPSAVPSSSFHPSAGPYLGGGYNMNGMGSIPGDGSSGIGAADMSFSSFGSIRNPLKRPGEDLDSLANGAGRVSPRDRERERERQREQASLEEQAQALRRPASLPTLGANGVPGAGPYMAGTPTMGGGPGALGGPSTPSGSGMLAASASDSRFRGYGPAQGTPTSMGAAPPMSTPFNFTPRSAYDHSLGGTSSLMSTPASQQHPYVHSNSHSYAHSSHATHGHENGAYATSSSPHIGMSTGVPDFMRSTHALGGPEHHMPHYAPQHGFDHDAYHHGRSAGSTFVQLQGPVPQPVPTISEGAPRASLEIEGDLERQVFGWDHEEWTNGRRLLQFWRRQEGTTIHASFKNVLQREYDQPDGPRGIIISCIFRPDKNECFITSVDLIYLLESLINNRFTVEEKNRIRRNLEGFRPITISKNKPDCSAFFKRIMGFPAPKPRNIEKDVKVFAWASLRPALCKIVGKYYASYTPGTVTTPGLAMGQDLPPGMPLGASGTTSATGLSMAGSASMPLGVVGAVSRTPSLEQQMHRATSGASLRSPMPGTGASAAALHGSPAGGSGNTSLTGAHGLGPAASALSSITAGAGPTGAYSNSHPLSLQGGSASYATHEYHSAASTPTTAGPANGFAYPDYMQSAGYGHASGISSLSGTPAMASGSMVGTPSAQNMSQRNMSGSSSNPPSGTAGSVGLGLGPSPLPPPPVTHSNAPQHAGSNYVYSPSATGASATGGGGAYHTATGAILGSLAAGTGGPAQAGSGSYASPSTAGAALAGAASGGSNNGAGANGNGNGGSNGTGSGSFPVPVIGGVGGDVSHDFASGILPAPQPGRARGLSASLASATSGSVGGPASFRR